MKDNGIPDLFIEKLLLDELPQDMKERLLKDPSVRHRLEELKAENRRILAEYPPEEMAKAIKNRERLSRRTEEAQSGRARPEGKRLSRPRSSPCPQTTRTSSIEVPHPTSALNTSRTRSGRMITSRSYGWPSMRMYPKR